MSRKFLSIGECMLELAPQHDDLYRMGFAGDTFNTAWYMNKLAGNDIETHYFTAVGDDAASARMVDFARSSGIKMSPKIVPGAPIGLYMISLNDGERSFQYWRSTSAARQLAQGLDVLPELSVDDFLFFSGITIAVLYPETRSHFLDLVAKARQSGVVVCFDPNLRPKLWASDNEMCEWVERAAAAADIVLPSYEDEAQFFGDVNAPATANRYLELGAELVVVKDGSNEVLVSDKDRNFETFEPDIVNAVIDSTAAGDSFNAGFLSQYMAGASVGRAVRKGCNVSAKVIAKRGALVEVS